MSPFLDDQVGSTPNQIRLFMVGFALPGALGLTGGGMAIFLHFSLVADHYTTLGGFIPAVLYAYAGQFISRRAIQMKDPRSRVILLTRLRSLLALSVIFAVAGLILSLVLLFVLGPAAASKDFVAGRIMSLSFSIVGVLLTPAALAARRIRWIAHPA